MCMKRDRDSNRAITDESTAQKRQCIKKTHDEKAQNTQDIQDTNIILPFPNLPEEIHYPIIAYHSRTNNLNELRLVNKWFSNKVKKKNIELITQKSLVISEQDQIYLLNCHADDKDDNPNIIKALLDNGFHPNLYDKILNASPRQIALSKNNEKIAQCLHDHSDFSADPTKLPRDIQRAYTVSSLTMAIYKGDRDEMVNLLNTKKFTLANVRQNTKSMIPALYVAAYLGHASIVSYILENFPNEHLKENNPWQIKNKYLPSQMKKAEHYAAQEGHTNILELLAPHLKNFNKKDHPLGSTPLHLASENNHTKTMSYLLEKGANIEAKNINGHTPLFTAAKKKSIEAMKLLIDAGANIKQTLSDQQQNIIHFILSRCTNPNIFIPIIEHCLDSGVDVNAQNHLEFTALHYAVIENCPDIVKLLLKHNANKNIADLRFVTPLDIATENGYTEIIELLTDLPFPNLPEEIHYPIIAYHSRTNNLNELRLVNKWFSNKVKKENIELITQKSLVINKNDQKHLLLYHANNDKDDPTVIKALLNNGFNQKEYSRSTPLHRAIQNNRINIISFLLENGANIDEPYPVVGHTPLFFAAFMGHLEATNLLIKSGANIKHLLPNSRKNILHCIFDVNPDSTNPSTKVIQVCLDHGIDINARDTDGNTALIYATKDHYIYKNKNHHIEMIKFLLERSADKNIANNFGKTPLDIATENENAEIMNLLTDK